MNPDNYQAILDLRNAVSNLLEKADSLDSETNRQSPFDIADIELAFQEVSEAISEVREKIGIVKAWGEGEDADLED